MIDLLYALSGALRATHSHPVIQLIRVLSIGFSMSSVQGRKISLPSSQPQVRSAWPFPQTSRKLGVSMHHSASDAINEASDSLERERHWIRKNEHIEFEA